MSGTWKHTKWPSKFYVRAVADVDVLTVVWVESQVTGVFKSLHTCH